MEDDEDLSLASGVISVTSGPVYEEGDMVLDHFVNMEFKKPRKFLVDTI